MDIHNKPNKINTTGSNIINSTELYIHNKPNDIWISIGENVYDITEYLIDKHPGGKYLPLQIAGKDATSLFYSTHPKYAETILNTSPLIYKKGIIQSSLNNFTYDSEFYVVCKQRIHKYFKNTNQNSKYHRWDSTDTICKIFAMVILWTMGWYFRIGWLWVVCQSIVTQMFFFSVMHTNNHGSGGHSNKIKFILDFVVDSCGGVSTIAWRHLHNVSHHFNTNIPDHDVDIQNVPWFRFNSIQPKFWWHKYQHIYASILMCLFPAVKMEIKHSYISLTLPNVHYEDRLRWLFGKIFYWILFLILPIYWHGIQFALSAIYIRYMICSFIYTHVIAPNHINELCQKINSKDWYIHQVYTTSNTSSGNILTNWFTSGLNHQIEHHLFPMIHHLHYPHIQPIIKKTIEEYNLPYNEHNGMISAVFSFWRWLYIIARKD